MVQVQEEEEVRLPKWETLMRSVIKIFLLTQVLKNGKPHFPILLTQKALQIVPEASAGTLTLPFLHSHSP